jgi:integrase
VGADAVARDAAGGVGVAKTGEGDASWLLQAGEPIVCVKDQLGHSSIQVTVDVYDYFVPGANRAAVDPPARLTW